jgi:hypothetical protein
VSQGDSESLANETPPCRRLSCVFRNEGDDSRGDDADPMHPLRSLLGVGLQHLWRPLTAAEEKLAQDADITHGKREALSDQRVVVTSRIADQGDAVGERFARPRVITLQRGAGPGDGSRGQRIAVGHRPQVVAMYVGKRRTP